MPKHTRLFPDGSVCAPWRMPGHDVSDQCPLVRSEYSYLAAKTGHTLPGQHARENEHVFVAIRCAERVQD